MIVIFVVVVAVIFIALTIISACILASRSDDLVEEYFGDDAG